MTALRCGRQPFNGRNWAKADADEDAIHCRNKRGMYDPLFGVSLGYNAP